MRIFVWRSILPTVLLVTLAQASPLHKSGDGLISSDPTENGYPKNVRPKSYTIVLEPHLVENDFTFNGESNIDVIINEPATNTIVLHAADLEIEKEFTSLVDPERKTTLKPTKQSLETVKEFLIIEFAEPIAPGTYTLNLRYTGKLNEDPKGFYRNRRQIGGRYVWEAFTQFKPSYARRAFPCFDETAMTARFSIWIKRPENYVANSTALAAKRTDDGNDPWTNFISSGLVSTDEVDFKVVDGANARWEATSTTTCTYSTTTSTYPSTTDRYTSTTYEYTPSTPEIIESTTPEATASASPPTIPPPTPPTNQKCIHANYLFTCTLCQPVINISLS